MRDFNAWTATAVRSDSSAAHKERDLMSSVHECLSRIERAYLDILEDLEPIDRTITLWWGLDGLRLNQDGTTELVSRKSQGKTVFYQPCQSVRPIQTGMFFADQTQCTRAQIDALMSQCTELQAQSRRVVQIENMVQQCCVQGVAHGYLPGKAMQNYYPRTRWDFGWG